MCGNHRQTKHRQGPDITQNPQLQPNCNLFALENNQKNTETGVGEFTTTYKIQIEQNGRYAHLPIQK